MEASKDNIPSKSRLWSLVNKRLKIHSFPLMYCKKARENYYKENVLPYFQPWGCGPATIRASTEAVSSRPYLIRYTRHRRSSNTMLVSTFVTANVQEASDAVHHDRVIRRMHMQDWPNNILCWASLVLKDRGIQGRCLRKLMTPKRPAYGIP